MKYAVEMGSDATIYILSFIRLFQEFKELMGGIHRQHCDLISLLLFCQYEGSRLKRNEIFRPKIKNGDMIENVCVLIRNQQMSFFLGGGGWWVGVTVTLVTSDVCSPLTLGCRWAVVLK
jgi:hypothetical protein